MTAQLPPAPDTVTEAVEFLRGEGYDDEFRVEASGLRCERLDGVHPLEAAVVDYEFRFEGPSDPGDEAIVLGIHLPEWDVKGIVVSAFGHDADPDSVATLSALTRRQSQ